ncbi:multicopper oxidase family protein [Pedococcus bigeumensis]|uniref:Multicopper oxidase family protein n=1 Tax=Pedococcus bigeumensis TaxID=433644 RepID=A0A502CV99_9MICO|nr:multicopper oxidase family protein [Pedococcus bigeumensis]TPG16838.1 multicopper oxidase family protein [Pedococcus bigeumensis]
MSRPWTPDPGVGRLARRTVLAGGAGLAGLGVLAACGAPTTRLVTPTAPVVGVVERARLHTGRTVTSQLSATPGRVDLGGPVVDTWSFGTVPGPTIRARAGDRLVVDLSNGLPTPTTVHWHGIALRNDMDGVPDMTQAPVAPNTSFRYDFTVPDPGTYFFHPHVGVQLDRGLYGVLVVDDPAEPGAYDHEWVVVLDDWIDGTGRTPDQVLASLRAATGSGMGATGGMGGMGMGGGGMGGESMTSPLLGGAGDIAYPYYLVNGRVPAAPVTLTGRPGQRVRVRLVNAASDTAFRVAVGGHQLSLTHADGFPVVPVTGDAVLLGMGERVDVMLNLGDGAFPLVASAEGKQGQGMAVVRTSTGPVPTPQVRPEELDGRVLTVADLTPAEPAAMPVGRVDRTHDVVLGGSMSGYEWTINGRTFDHERPLDVRQGERVRLRLKNATMMFHPMHLHGHTFAVVDAAGRPGVRKDTVIVAQMRTVTVDLDATNPGQWMTHCHNAYHGEAGMMTTLSYRT